LVDEPVFEEKKWGKIETLTLAEKRVFNIPKGILLICLEKKQTLGVIRGMVDWKIKPSRVVYLDEGFKDTDQLKINTVQIFKTQGITIFRTV
jgi:adenine-specific DNA-methyltransferase